MKINKFITMAAIALMAVGAMGFITTQTHAQSIATPAAQIQNTAAPDNEQADVPDTDNVEEQSGDQNTLDSNANSANESTEAESNDAQDALPTGTPGISSDAALKVAQEYLHTVDSGTPTLDDENGKLVYSIDIKGRGIKVDAISGAVLVADQGSDVNSQGGN